MAGLNLTGTASLAEELDSTPRAAPPPPSRSHRHSHLPLHRRRRAEKILVLLRDGKKVIGTLRSFDQFANIVLEEAVERIVVGKQYADVPLGLYVIRGENTVLIGAIVRRAAAAITVAMRRRRRRRRQHHRRRYAPPRHRTPLTRRAAAARRTTPKRRTRRPRS